MESHLRLILTIQYQWSSRHVVSAFATLLWASNSAAKYAWVKVPRKKSWSLEPPLWMAIQGSILWRFCAWCQQSDLCVHSWISCSHHESWMPKARPVSSNLPSLFCLLHSCLLFDYCSMANPLSYCPLFVYFCVILNLAVMMCYLLFASLLPHYHSAYYSFWSQRWF